MRKIHDLAPLDWTLTGYTPETWRGLAGIALGAPSISEVAPLPARVPASVQQLLREHGIIPDWNHGLDSRAVEWVENRHWVFSTSLPRAWLEAGPRRVLHCAGLDAAGWVCCNGQLVGRFENGFVEHTFDLAAVPVADENPLHLVFDLPPRWLGQFNLTSKLKDWKARFNYTWDWQPRLVQIGVWDRITLEVGDERVLTDIRCQLAPNGFTLFGHSPDSVEVRLTDGETCLLATTLTPAQLAHGVAFADLPVEPWWPNREGPQQTYRLSVQLGADGDVWARTVGFKSVTWAPCADAPAGADPWLCVVNGRPMFLQGVNWTPIRPNYADVTDTDYEARIRTYVEMGCNILRVWGGAFLEKEIFYDLCDKHGLLVWQEFPFSSSGIDNWPPEDPAVIAAAEPIVRSYITRRQHHASLLCWCGGNELQGAPDGGKTGTGLPVTRDHPLIAMMADAAAELDPDRRFLPTSASGPRFNADAAEFGRGVHWDVHGPWWPADDHYWDHDDALFRSEVGVAGASPLDLLEQHYDAGTLLPFDDRNPLWRRFGFWIQTAEFKRDHGREPRDLAEFVAWSQMYQRTALVRAARASKRRFPACGGFIVWMGHDTFPCPANTAILDFLGRPKPAALGLGEVFLTDPSQL